MSASAESQVHPSISLPSQEHVGIDVGLKTFAHLSTGEQIAHPRFFREEEAALSRAQRKLAQAAQGSTERATRRKVVARIHERIGQRREKGCRSKPRAQSPRASSDLIAS